MDRDDMAFSCDFHLLLVADQDAVPLKKDRHIDVQTDIAPAMRECREEVHGEAIVEEAIGQEFQGRLIGDRFHGAGELELGEVQRARLGGLIEGFYLTITSNPKALIALVGFHQTEMDFRLSVQQRMIKVEQQFRGPGKLVFFLNNIRIFSFQGIVGAGNGDFPGFYGSKATISRAFRTDATSVSFAVSALPSPVTRSTG